GAGTADGPKAILEASPQLDLYDEDLGNIWQHGIAMLPISESLRSKSQHLREMAEPIILMQEAGKDPNDDPVTAQILAEINVACAEMNDWVEHAATALLEQNKQVALLGGDHSTPLGFMRALAKKHGSFGILQIDAHMDLRNAYEGFTHSHASIMYNALALEDISRLVQVGIRDMCEEEIDLANGSDGRVRYFTDRALQKAAFAGKTWAETCAEIISYLPAKVYFSFDIDGLEPWLCPNTGTPVGGGLGYEQTMYLLDQVRLSGREIIAVDLVEVNPGTEGSQWDGSVGARILYRMCGMMAFRTELTE
ncbi:MAG TPA: agmatinase family protein, partial [Bacteroidia bacterium]|nr:agmatinase family protein [Bacteroidia bacterium]